MTKTGTLLTLILFCATFLILKGQSGDAIGYIVTFDDDTLRGSLKHESEKASPRELIFFADGSASAIIYDPKTIKAFGYENNIFISADIDREISPTKLNELSDSPQLFYVKDTVFLQVIISGEKELLSFVDENGKENFYIKDDDKWEKDEDKVKLRKAIKGVAYKNERMRPIWYDSTPDVGIMGTENYEKFFKYSESSLGGCGKEETRLFEDKVMKNVLREVTIDKTKALE